MRSPLKPMRLFSVVPPNALIRSWIAVRHDWRVIHISWPWFWGRVGIGWGIPFRFYTFSEWREMHFS